MFDEQKSEKGARTNTRYEALENLQLRYEIVVDEVEEQAFNPGIFDASIPVAKHEHQRAETPEAAEQESLLLTDGMAFSASGHWNHCKSCIGNAGVTIRAQKEQLWIDEAARLRWPTKRMRQH